MLCIALTLVFAGASMTSIVDRVQHEAGVTADHEHLPLSIIAFDASDHDGGHPEAMTPDDSGKAPGHQPDDEHHHQDRKSVVEGKSVSVRVEPGGRRIIKKKKQKQ